MNRDSNGTKTLLIGIDLTRAMPSAGWARESATARLLTLARFGRDDRGGAVRSTGQCAHRNFLEAPHLNRTINAKARNRMTSGPNGEKVLDPRGIKQMLDVGRNLGKAEFLRDFIKAKGGNCELVESKTGRFSFTKMKEVDFRLLGIYSGPTSEHGRDAALLIHPLNKTFGDWSVAEAKQG
jgi:hypothetical protein